MYYNKFLRTRTCKSAIKNTTQTLPNNYVNSRTDSAAKPVIIRKHSIHYAESDKSNKIVLIPNELYFSI